jgi:hypothetical protein
MYEAVKEKLMGSPIDQVKNSIIGMSTNYQNGHFIMSFSCGDDHAIVKKNLLALISKFTPLKYYAKYSHNIKLLNGKPDRAEFKYCASLLKDMKPQIFIAQKTEMKESKFTTLVKAVNSKRPTFAEQKGTRPYSLSKRQGNTTFPMNTAPGYRAVFVKDYINSTGLPTAIHSGNVIVYNKPWNVNSKKITKKHIDKFVKHKYSKIKKALVPVMLFTAASKCWLDVPNMIKLYEDQPTVANISKFTLESM